MVMKMAKAKNDALTAAEKKLFNKIDSSYMPRHVAMIMDGNGRWAKKRGLPRIKGHHAGRKTVKMVVKETARIKIPVVTLYAFSHENWQRPPDEVQGLMELLYNTIEEEVHELHENQVRLKFLGRIHELTPELQKKISWGENFTKDNKKLTLNIALNYGARGEIVDAAKKIIEDIREGKLSADELTEESFSTHLLTGGLQDPDLLIRTAGEFRISNYLLWQCAYAEFYFTKTLWPDFSRSDYYKAILDFQKRERRFGKTGEQLG